MFDINEDFVNCYNAIKNDVTSVIAELRKLERRYLKGDESQTQKTCIYRIREEFNPTGRQQNSYSSIRRVSTAYTELTEAMSLMSRLVITKTQQFATKKI